jgi:hypothetical protein
MVYGLRLQSPFKGGRNKNSTPSTVEELTRDEDFPSLQPTDSSKRRMLFGLSFQSPFKGKRNKNSTPSTVEETTSDEDSPSLQPTDPSKRGRTSNFLFASPLIRKKRKTETPAKKANTPVNHGSRRRETTSKQSVLKRHDSYPLSSAKPYEGVTFSDVLGEEPCNTELNIWEATPTKYLDSWLYAGCPGGGVSTPMTPTTASRGSASKGNTANWSVSRRLGPDYDAVSESIAVMVDEEMPEVSDVVDGSSTEDVDMRDASESLANLSIVEFDFHEDS